MRFYLIDRIIEYHSMEYATAIKNVALSEDFFDDHFPTFPIMPGVLMLEGLAQLSGFLLRFSLKKKNEKNEEKGREDRKALFVMVEKAKFRGIVRPGDQLLYTAELMNVDTEVGRTKVKGEVGGEKKVEGILNFVMVENANPVLNQELDRTIKFWTGRDRKDIEDINDFVESGVFSV
ncbi:MAG: beta-hydroxyacyl-ACP dehydratase [Oligoflexia bacterium]|nr:beta-hydroxyacyl-ACP dehydratase [Oligoflexia bacterium]